MAKNDQVEAFEKLMSTNHGRMIDLVKFAETKNAALLTFCSVWMAAIINMLRAPEDLPLGYKYAFIAALPLLLLAALISLKSFLPRLLHHVYNDDNEYRNFLYFHDIARGGIKKYPDMAAKLYMPEENQSATPTYLHDLGVQTAIQASIAQRKFRLFHWSGTLVLIAFGCMSIPPIIFFLRWAIAQLHC